MPDPVLHALHTALDRIDLSEAEAAAAVGAIMDGTADEVAVAGLLVALRMKGESAAEIAGAARAMRQRACRIPAKQGGLLDTCGTGGDGLRTFNISTAAAIVAAAAGVPVAKHGNRAASSSSGSADVLEALGVNITLNPEQVAECLAIAGIGFCFAPLCHGAMAHAMPVRTRLGVRTLFNLLGPLTNPAGASYQLIGASSTALAEKLADALSRFRPQCAVVVCGNNELDEVCLWGPTAAFLVTGESVTRADWEPRHFAPACSVSVADLVVSTPQESAAVIRDVLGGQPGPRREIVVANAAAALFAAERVSSVGEGAEQARAVLDNGKAATVLHKLADTSQRLAGA